MQSDTVGSIPRKEGLGNTKHKWLEGWFIVGVSCMFWKQLFGNKVSSSYFQYEN